MGNKFKINSKIMLIIGLIFIVSGLLLYFILNSNNKSNKEEEKKTETVIVGNEDYGYISIPEDWKVINEIQDGYSYKGTINNYIVTVNKHKDITIVDFKENCLKEQIDKNAININVDYLDSGEIIINSYPDNSNSWEAIMIKELEDGQIVTVTLSGPVKDDEFYNILKTYREKK